MKKNRMLVSVILTVLVCTTCGASAAVLAGWDVEGVDVEAGVGIATNAAPYSFYATTTEVSQVEAMMTLGAGVNPSTTSGQYGFKISTSDQTNTLAGAIALNHYMEFKLTVSNGYALNLSSIEMYGGGSGTGCSNIVVMTDIDGFVAGQEIAEAPAANGTGGFDTDSSGFGGPIDLSDSRYQNLTGTITFRLYGWNSTSGSGVTYLRNWATSDDLVVYGDVVVVPGTGMPMLAMSHSNDMVAVSVEFDGTPSTNYVLQKIGSLTDTNGWTTISDPVSSSTNWLFETSSSAAFYRIVPE